jgi:hypothetical protein
MTLALTHRCGKMAGVLRRRTVVMPIAVLLLAGAACTRRGSPASPGATESPTRPPAVRSVGALPEWDRPGDRDWRVVRVGRQHDVEGFADHDSVLAGEPVRLYVSTVAGRFRVRAYRMGWYRGALARLVWLSAWQPGRRQRAAVVGGAVHTVWAPWRASLVVPTGGWVPGMYLLRIDTDRGVLRRFVPLTVRSQSMRGAVVLVNADTTWQAYNDWGGYSLYHGPDGAKDSRSRAVSFDRPYGYGAGAGDFIGAELPLLALAERLGLPLGYATDVDLHRRPHLLDAAAAVISLGHDEYWSPAMRTAVTTARDHGTNVAFLGANAVFRKIRFGSTGLGPDRLEINYKDATDPIGRVDPAQVTTQWREPPSSDPESSLTGTYYRCNPVRADMVVADPSSWLLAGLGLRAGDRLPNVVGSEYDRVHLATPTPRPIHILFHSPLRCGGLADASDVAYYTVRSGAAGFDAGTSDWVTQLDSRNTRVRTVVTTVTSRLLEAFTAGPAGRAHPVTDNAARYTHAPNSW